MPSPLMQASAYLGDSRVVETTAGVAFKYGDETWYVKRWKQRWDATNADRTKKIEFSDMDEAVRFFLGDPQVAEAPLAAAQ